MNRSISLFFFGVALLPLNGQEEILPLSPSKEQKQKERKENEDARFRIPLGAVVSDVSLPYFGENNRPISLLTAEELTVEGADPHTAPNLEATTVQLLNGNRLKLWLFDKQGLVKSITTIPKAKYHVTEEKIVTSGKLITRGTHNKFAAQAQGAIFALKTGQVLLLGPGLSRFRIPQKKETTMNLRPILPLGTAVQMLIAAPPTVDQKHFEEFERAVTSPRLPEINAEQKFATAELHNQALTQRATNYLTTIGQSQLLTPSTTPPPTKSDPFDSSLELGPSDISIEFDKGAYFDSEALEVAYFGNIKIEGLGLKITCNKDLKAIFNPPASGKKEQDQKGSPIKNFAGFGDLKQVTANGRIRLEGTDKEGKKFFLRGDRALFESNPKNPKKEGIITLRGDNLSFIQGDPLNKKSEEPIIRGDSSSKNAWAIVNIKQGLAPDTSDLSVQFSPGNFKIGIINRKKK